ncbi:MAG: TIR domain-containing protein [Candidatus Thorarchaeota archaeon]
MKNENGNKLLEMASLEEKKYNWIEAGDIYNQVLKNLHIKGTPEKIASLYKKLGYINSKAADTVEKLEKYVELKKIAIESYREASEIFKQKNYIAEELESKAENYFESSLIKTSFNEGKGNLDKALDHFIQASKIFSNNGDMEGYTRNLIRASMATFYLMNYIKDPIVLRKIIEMGIDFSIQAWKASRKLKNIQYITESLLMHTFIGLNNCFIAVIPKKENWNNDLSFAFNYFEFFDRVKESYELAKNCEDPRIQGLNKFLLGFFTVYYGFYFSIDENEQREYLEKGLDLFKEGLVNIIKTKESFLIIICTFWLDWYAFFGGKIDYIQKKIYNDLEEIKRLSKIYSNSLNMWNFYANFLPALYFANIAQRSFFTLEYRKTYANKAIEYANESIKNLAFEPNSAWAYQILTWSYSQLTNLASSEIERKNEAESMLENAKNAEIIGEKYKAGLSRTSEYSALYRAYKTLADISESKVKKIEYLKIAVESAEKYLDHAIESRTGMILAKIRLGFLYEELGIIASEKQYLVNAKEAFLNSIKDSSERGYYSYEAASHEYLAHIEDRLGNYLASADQYHMAQKAYQKSLEIIEYKLLINRIKEKINYTQAWSLIENAKLNHKKEDHIKSEEYYTKAFEILKDLKSYNYEAPYYFAWKLIEISEDLSKKEQHYKAIEQYTLAKNRFNDVIIILEKKKTEFRDKIILNRIKKLTKIAKLRMYYCSARIDLEEARILGKEGNKLIAAEKFKSAAQKFGEIDKSFKNEREAIELKAVYYLCKAWENMELAESYEEPKKFSEASSLFEKASNLFKENKLKLLAQGNSLFCQALEKGSIFDNSTNINVKSELYPKIKMLLRNAASSYHKGGFESAADWAIGSSSYFDATWNLIKADLEMDLEEKKKLLDIGFGILSSTAQIFAKSGYKNKEKEVMERLDMIKKEENIIFSALNTIIEPSISKSTLGIVAPACPLETSLSPRISEISQFTEEERRVLGKELKLEVNKFKIFISYATKDSKYFQVSDIAKKLLNYREIGEVLYWEESLKDDIYSYMNKNLGLCDTFLLFCSSNALQSEAVEMEWQAALKIKKKIIPIFIKESDIPPLLSTKLGVQFIKEDLEKTIEQIHQLILKKLNL